MTQIIIKSSEIDMKQIKKQQKENVKFKFKYKFSKFSKSITIKIIKLTPLQIITNKFMSLSSLKSNISSPSFPSNQQVSGDIFFKVKKQILDKLDIILQKVNLQVIQYLKLQSQKKQQKASFKFIQLSQFQKEIQTLFDYLDRLYQSLNSSVSFSSNDIKNTLSNNQSSNVQSTKRKNQLANQYNTLLAHQFNQFKLKYQHLQEQNNQLMELNHQLRQQNQHMKFLLKNNISQSYSLAHYFNQQSKGSLKNNKNQQTKNKQSIQSNKSNKSNKQQNKQRGRILQQEQSAQSNSIQKQQPAAQMQGISLETVKKILRFYNHSIRQLSVDYKQSIKQIKKILKQVKFQIIQNRVQCIAQLKKYSQQNYKQSIQKQSLYGQINQYADNKQTQKKNIKVQSVKHKQSIQQYCNQDCINKYYNQKGDKIGFQQDLLQKIQQILDVC